MTPQHIVRNLRHQMSYAEIAEKSGITPNTVYKIARGDIPGASLVVINKILAIVGQELGPIDKIKPSSSHPHL